MRGNDEFDAFQNRLLYSAIVIAKRFDTISERCHERFEI